MTNGFIFDLWAIAIAAGVTALAILAVRLVRWWRKPVDPWTSFRGKEWK